MIAGAGPAGLTAGIYGRRAKLETIIVEQSFPGGTITLADKIENYPGFPRGVSGQELAALMEQQYRNLGGQILNGEISQVVPGKQQHTLILSDGQKLIGPALIIATGTTRKKLGVPGEENLAGRGVSYCAVCDGAFFKNRTVAVVGGGDAALMEALHLAHLAARCFLIHRRDSFRAAASLQEEVFKNPKITPVLSAVVESITGSTRVESIVVRSLATGKTEPIAVDGVFVSVGQQPRSEFLNEVVRLSPSGHILTDETMATSCPGIFACGDVRKKHLYQIVSACSDGAIAAYFAERYLTQSGK